MAIYFLSIGNSSEGPIGLVARIHAESPEDAIDRFNDDCQEIEERHFEGFDYISTYTNSKHITVADLELSETEDCDEDECEFCGDNQAADDDDAEVES